MGDDGRCEGEQDVVWSPACLSESTVPVGGSRRGRLVGPSTCEVGAVVEAPAWPRFVPVPPTSAPRVASPNVRMMAQNSSRGLYTRPLGVFGARARAALAARRRLLRGLRPLRLLDEEAGESAAAAAANGDPSGDPSGVATVDAVERADAGPLRGLRRCGAAGDAGACTRSPWPRAELAGPGARGGTSGLNGTMATAKPGVAGGADGPAPFTRLTCRSSTAVSCRAAPSAARSFRSSTSAAEGWGLESDAPAGSPDAADASVAAGWPPPEVPLPAPLCDKADPALAISAGFVAFTKPPCSNIRGTAAARVSNTQG